MHNERCGHVHVSHDSVKGCSAGSRSTYVARRVTCSFPLIICSSDCHYTIICMSQDGMLINITNLHTMPVSKSDIPSALLLSFDSRTYKPYLCQWQSVLLVLILLTVSHVYDEFTSRYIVSVSEVAYHEVTRIIRV